MGAAWHTNDNAYRFEISAAGILFEIDYSLDVSAAGLVGEIEYSFKIGTAGLMTGMDITLT